MQCITSVCCIKEQIFWLSECKGLGSEFHRHGGKYSASGLACCIAFHVRRYTEECRAWIPRLRLTMNSPQTKNRDIYVHMHQIHTSSDGALAFTTQRLPNKMMSFYCNLGPTVPSVHFAHSSQVPKHIPHHIYHSLHFPLPTPAKYSHSG